MSFNTDVVHALNVLWRETILKQKETASIIVPVASQTLSTSNGNLTILMDYEQLQEATDMTFVMEGSNYTVPAHDLRGEFAYESFNMNPYTSVFHLTGDPGLFSIGARDWLTTDTALMHEIKVVVRVYRETGPFSYETINIIKGSQQLQVFLGSNESFRLEYDSDSQGTNPNEATILSGTELVITRLSRNPYYVAAITPP
jgi:hypothetical protein